MSSHQTCQSNAVPYIYTPLVTTSTSQPGVPGTAETIRLLTIEHTSSQHDIHVRMEQSSLTDGYVAVSYMWGPPEPAHSIYVDGQRLKVRENIYRFLKHQIRNRNTTIAKFWIDSICINQNDLAEKSQQVAIMGEIFNHAGQVLIWLGDASENNGLTRYAEDHKVDVHEVEWSGFFKTTTIGQSIPRDKDAEHHLGLIINNDYWTRLWVVQEIQLARDLAIVFGRTKISLEAVGSMLAFCFQRRFDHDRLWPRPKLDLTIPRDDTDTARALFNIKFQRGRAMGDGKVSSQSFIDLLATFENQKCTDPKDKIYGLLSLTPYTNVDFPVDYACSVAKIFSKVVHFMQQEVTKTSDSRYCSTACVPMPAAAGAMDALAVSRRSLQSLQELGDPTTVLLHLEFSQRSPFLGYVDIDRSVLIKLKNLLPGAKESGPVSARFWACSLGAQQLETKWIYVQSDCLQLKPVCLAHYFRAKGDMRISRSSKFECPWFHERVRDFQPVWSNTEDMNFTGHVSCSPADLVQLLVVTKNFERAVEDYESHFSSFTA